MYSIEKLLDCFFHSPLALNLKIDSQAKKGFLLLFPSQQKLHNTGYTIQNTQHTAPNAQYTIHNIHPSIHSIPSHPPPPTYHSERSFSTMCVHCSAAWRPKMEAKTLAVAAGLAL